MQKLMRTRVVSDAIAQQFPPAHRVSSLISSAGGIFLPGRVDLFFTRMSFFS
jgi:hypothetical protein